MTEPLQLTKTPLVMLVDDQEWMSRSLESILSPEGFAVLKAYTGSQALSLAERVPPDAIILDRHLPDMNGVDVCRELRESGILRPSTPVFMLSAGPVNREDRVESLRAGAWELLRPPFDPEVLILQMRVFLGAKQEVDVTREEGLIDLSTGLYNVKGLIKRLDELGSAAARYRRALACVAIGPDRDLLQRRDTGPEDGISEARSKDAPASASVDLTETVRGVTRISDVVGRVSESDFIVVAPDTDERGASVLAERILSALESQDPSGDGILGGGFLAGYYAVNDAQVESPAPADVLTRAKLALLQSQKQKGQRRRISPFVRPN